MATIAALHDDISTMGQLFDEVVRSSEMIGGFDDGPDLRDNIQGKVKRIKQISSQVKSVFNQFGDDDPRVKECQGIFDQLNAKMQSSLPGVIDKLRNNINSEAAPQPAFQYQMMDQQQVDAETEYLMVLEQEVNSILETMKEVNQIFHQTLEELQKQRHILVDINTSTTGAATNMQSGNDELQQAEHHQKKCIIW